MPGVRAGASSRPSSARPSVQDDAEAAKTQWRQVTDQLRPKVPKLAALMDEAEADVLAFFPKDHRPKIHSINPLGRLNGEIKPHATSQPRSSVQMVRRLRKWDQGLSWNLTPFCRGRRSGA